MIRQREQANKKSGLPLGVSKTWRRRAGRRPYLELLVTYRDQETGRMKTRHFYVGTDPDETSIQRAFREAVRFRQAYASGRA